MISNNTLIHTSLLFVLLLVVGWLYYPAMDSFFANDDWVILYHNYQVSPWQPWLYFNPNTVWFYRPLQSMQFGLTWHWAGFNHHWYSGQLLIMHGVVIVLGWLFARKLFSIGVAWLATVLFCCSWIYVDILLWKANLNTLQHAITTLLSAYLFLCYLDSRRWSVLAASIVVAIINCFTKESCVSLLLVLAGVWFARHLQGSWQSGKPVMSHWQATAKKAIGLMWPFAAVTVVYVILHRLLITNIEPRYKPGYFFASPLGALGQWMHSINHALFGFVYDPLLLRRVPSVQNLLVKVVKYGYIIPPVLLMAGYWRKNALIVFSLLFTAAALFPTFALGNYHASRYYYLPAYGGALFLAGCLLPLLQNLSGITALPKKVLAYGATVFLLWMMAGNILLTQQLVAQDHQQSVKMETAARYIKTVGPQIPADAVIVFRNAPSTFMSNGMGATEMVSMVTKRTDLAALAEKQSLTDEHLAEIESRKTHLLLDVETTAPVFMSLRD